MKPVKSFPVLFFIPFLLTSCFDKLNDHIGEDGLPHGENTLYYYVDGALVIPKTKFAGERWLYGISYSYCPQGTTNAGSLELSDSEHLYMLITDLSQGRHDFQQEEYPLCNNVNGTSAFMVVREADSTGNLSHNDYYTRQGSGYIRFDYVSPDKRRFRGTFEMDLYCDLTHRTKHITDGHFNINLDKLHQY